MTDSRSVVIERDYAHPPEKIWRALTEPHLIAEWLMKADFRAASGHRFRMESDWGGIDCEVLAVEPCRFLSYSWKHDHDDPAVRLDSVVTFTLTPSVGGTRLRVEQTGFLSEQRRAFGGARAGWERFLDKLQPVIGRA